MEKFSQIITWHPIETAPKDETNILLRGGFYYSYDEGRDIQIYHKY